MLLFYQIAENAKIVVQLGKINIFVRMLFFKGVSHPYITKYIIFDFSYISTHYTNHPERRYDIYTFILVSIEIEKFKHISESQY